MKKELQSDDKKYTEDEIRDAFIRMFDGTGEWWFPYRKLAGDDNGERVQDSANEFLGFLIDVNKRAVTQ